MSGKYVEQLDGFYRITGTRVSLESVLFAFLDGLSPETIVAECFPTLTLEQIYGAITYYLAHRQEIDGYLAGIEVEFNQLYERTHDEEFAQKLTAHRRNASLSPS